MNLRKSEVNLNKLYYEIKLDLLDPVLFHFFTIIQWQLLKYYPYLLLLNGPFLILLFYDKY